jgi:hypothetical protein
LTERQEHLLRIMSDPTNVRPQLSPLDQAAIRVAIAERAELLEACNAVRVWIDSPEWKREKPRIMALIDEALSKAGGAS